MAFFAARRALLRSTSITPVFSVDFTKGTLPSSISFSRTTNAMVYDSTGKLTYAPNNLLTYSNTFSNAAWTKLAQGTGTAPVVTDNYAVAPDGSMTASRVQYSRTSSSSPDRSNLSQSPSIPTNTNIIQSVWLKSNTGTNQSIVIYGNWNTGPTTVATVTTAWQQFFITGNSGSSTSAVLWIGLKDSNTSALTADVLVWSVTTSLVTYETSPRSRDQVITTSAAYYGPRFDYDPATLLPKGLLIEEARTNSLPNSMMVGSVAGSPGTMPNGWGSLASPTNGLSRQIVGTGIENGMSYVDIRWSGIPSASQTGAAFAIMVGGTSIVASSGQTWTASTSARIVGGDLTNVGALVLRVRGMQSDGTTQLDVNDTSIIASISSTMKRFTSTATLSNAATAYAQTYLHFSYSNALPVDLTLRLAAPQLELGSFSTSYIPTTTAAATRSADSAMFTGAPLAALLYTTGSLVVEFQNYAGLSYHCVIVGSQISPTAVLLLAAQNLTQLVTYDAGATTPGAYSASGPAFTNVSRAALSWDGSGRSLGASGGTVTRSSSPFVTTRTSARLGAYSDGSYITNGWFSKLAIYTTRLSDAVLKSKSIVGGPL